MNNFKNNVAKSGDIITFHLPDSFKIKGDNLDDFYHYGLIIYDSQESKSLKVLYFDCALCECKISEFKEFYEEIKSFGYTDLTYRKIFFTKRDKEFYMRQTMILDNYTKKENSECDVKIARYINLMQSYGHSPMWFCVGKIENYSDF